MKRLIDFLAHEIRWGRVLGIAALVALVPFILPGGVTQLTSLMVFPLGAILVAQAAQKHPFWNALLYGIFGILFSALFTTLAILGTDPNSLSWASLRDIVSLFIWVIPQALIGAWVANTFRRSREVAEQRAKAAQEKGEAAPPSRKTETQAPPKGEKPSGGRTQPPAGSTPRKETTGKKARRKS